MSLRRRQANAPGGRPFRHEVWLTAEQEAMVVAGANSAGMTVPRFLVTAAVGRMPAGMVSRDDLAEMFAVGRHLGAVGRNLNQLAKVANATGDVPDDISQTLATIRASAQRLSAAIETVTGQ